MIWTGEHRGFAVRSFLENGRSVIATQRAMRLRFHIPRHVSVPDGKTIKRWVSSLEETGSTVRTHAVGRPRTATTPENVQLVRVSVERSPRRSARRHAVALGLSDRSVRRILHEELFFHPYKIMLVQELKHDDFVNRVNLRGDLGWPARSPDLSICDFFLWGYLKEKVFKHRPHTLQELKRRIIEEVNAIPIQMCQNAARSFQNRLHQCIATGGRHLADIVFKR
ncbi:PREDICTED: uncharacterized protein LOC106744010 [Dinoponera quadriceps]|uniref:Uncharacterized protein LOC106744010 n=1 Tax=Dinoponera quadriceps TaxID=609295 RepID=A0A6P3X6F4_DINQU|nr:PREDICTED: uncharacterized protein LOC106744010 [Dinoponera quadriceps]XP_014473879.1 PREDICTED: uncharacterized protein LOC106744010 [Dinoponera quadriceps]